MTCQGPEAETPSGTVNEQGGLSFAAEVLGDEFGTVDARDGDGPHAGTLPSVVAHHAKRTAGAPRPTTNRAVQHLLTESGYVALILLAFAEACCVPIPSEVTFGFAGVLAASGRLNLALVLVVGVAAELAGSSTAYAIGRIGGRPLVDRLGRYVLLTTEDLDRAERWLSGKGEIAVLVGRAMPVVRAFTAIVAGTADMSLARFEIFNLFGTIVYTGSFAAVGYGVGYEWKRVAHDVSFAGYALVAFVVVVVVAFIVHRLRALRRARRAGTTDPEATSPSRGAVGR